MAETILTISSKNYSSWSLRGWLLCRMAGLEFVEEVVPADDPANRAELLLLSPSILVPSLTHDGIRIWDTAGGASRGRPLSLDLRRDAFRVCQSTIRTADEPQSPPRRLQNLVGGAGRYRPYQDNLARVLHELSRALSLWEIDHGGRHVRAGCYPLPDL